jgi:transposase-like protein
MGMSGIVLCLNDVDNFQNGHTVVCPYCKSMTVRRWGSGTRNVFDTKPMNAVIFRYFCVDCNRTFRYYPVGVDRSQSSRRIRRLAALLWLMDISTRDVEEIYENLGVSINRMTVWREGQKLIEELSEKKLLSPASHYKINRSNLNNFSYYDVSFSICLDSCTIAMLGTIEKPDMDSLVCWLRSVLAGQDIEILNLNEFDFSSRELMYVPL